MISTRRVAARDAFVGHTSPSVAVCKHRPFLLVLAITGCLTFSSPHLLAQSSPATITAFADPLGASCTLLDDGEKMFEVYIIQSPAGGLVGSRFRIAGSPGIGAEYVSATVHLPFFMGDVQTGIDIAYGYCASGSLLLVTVTYLGHGTSQTCSYFEVLPHAQSYTGGIDVMDCQFDTWRASTLGPLLVNTVEGQCVPWCTVATRPTTWGALKALFR
jgi:hypothetical protein